MKQIFTFKSKSSPILRRFSTTARIHNLSNFTDEVLDQPYRRSYLQEFEKMKLAEEKIPSETL